jgi:hypothetical protein
LSNLASDVRPNLKRVEAGRLNRMKRGALTPKGKQALREAALRNKPWKYSTGPRTRAGKAVARKNGKKRQLDTLSVREIRAVVADAVAFSRRLRQERELVAQIP